MDRTNPAGKLSRRAALATALLAASCANVVAPTGSQPGAGGTGPGGTSAGGASAGGTGGTTPDINVSDAGPRPESGPTEDANCGLQNYALDRRPAVVVLLQ